MTIPTRFGPDVTGTRAASLGGAILPVPVVQRRIPGGAFFLSSRLKDPYWAEVQQGLAELGKVEKTLELR